MTGDTHYDLEILAELAEGLLDAGTARQVREHLAVCDPCGELLADLAAVREVLAATPTPAMPMGVALRIDNALAAESGRGGVGLVEAPDWDELTRDSPWEIAPEPARLGVVSDDGTVVPARRRVAPRRKWAMPAVAAAAAAVVVGTSVATVGLLAGGGEETPGGGNVAVAKPSQATSQLMGLGYGLTNSDWTYSDGDLGNPLQSYFGTAPMLGGSAVDTRLAKCVTTVANRSHLKPFAVDQGFYNGQEAAVIASWKDQSKNRVRVDVIDPFNCKNLRKPSLGRWK